LLKKTQWQGDEERTTHSTTPLYAVVVLWFHETGLLLGEEREFPLECEHVILRNGTRLEKRGCASDLLFAVRATPLQSLAIAGSTTDSKQKLYYLYYYELQSFRFLTPFVKRRFKKQTSKKDDLLEQRGYPRDTFKKKTTELQLPIYEID
jgi:hypothetical protein